MAMNRASRYIYEASDSFYEAKVSLDSTFRVSELFEPGRRFKKHLANAYLIDNEEYICLASVKCIESLKEGIFIFSGDDIFRFKNIFISGSELGLVKGCKYHYKIYVNTDIPMCLSGKDPSQGNYVEAEIYNINLVFSVENRSRVVNKDDHLIYETYHEYGFMLADIDKLNNYLKKHESGNDLIEEFTTTELASELFSEGLIALCWGLTPWPYYISSEANEQARLGKNSPFVGSYFFDESIKEVSVIKGESLTDWASCVANKWPKLKVLGSGNGLKISLYSEDELAVEERFMAGFSSPICTFYVKRENVETPVPLLEVNLFD